jgi:hypothetical protein
MNHPSLSPNPLGQNAAKGKYLGQKYHCKDRRKYLAAAIIMEQVSQNSPGGGIILFPLHRILAILP